MALSPQERAHRAQLRAWREEQREAREFALRVERTRRRGDFMMSLAQASATNPIFSHACLGLAGAAIGTATQAAREAASRFDVGRGRVEAWPITPMEIFGDGLLALAGARATAETAEGIISAIRGQGAVSNSVAFDIPDSEGAVIFPAQAGDTFRPAPRLSRRR